jgi:hypothetical protein
MSDKPKQTQNETQLVYNLDKCLEWLNNLEKAIGTDALLSAMPNNWGGRIAIEQAIKRATEGQ